MMPSNTEDVAVYLLETMAARNADAEAMEPPHDQTPQILTV